MHRILGDFLPEIQYIHRRLARTVDMHCIFGDFLPEIQYIHRTHMVLANPKRDTHCASLTPLSLPDCHVFFHLHMHRVGQKHIYTVCIQYFRQGNYHIYGHIRCIYTVLANPTYAPIQRIICAHTLVYTSLGLARTVHIHRTFEEIPAKYTAYTPCIYMVLANPTHHASPHPFHSVIFFNEAYMDFICVGLARTVYIHRI
jgi:hypothetical protein